MGSWTWRFEDADGNRMTGPQLPEVVFDSQAEAESWLAISWRDLLEADVTTATLIRDDTVYGTLDLTS